MQMAAVWLVVLQYWIRLEGNLVIEIQNKLDNVEEDRAAVEMARAQFQQNEVATLGML